MTFNLFNYPNSKILIEFKVYMTDFFLFARSILSDMLISAWKDFFRNLFFRRGLAT